MKKLVLLLTVIADIGVLAGHMQEMSREDAAEVIAFLEDFKDACNTQDAERVRSMASGAWSHLSRSIRGGEKIERIEVLGITTEGGTNVITKATLRGGRRGIYSQEVVFSLDKNGDSYEIKRISVPEIDKHNEEMTKGFEILKKLETAIHHGNMDEVKPLLTFGSSDRFEEELSSRGLFWIKYAVESGSPVSIKKAGIRREGSRLVASRIMALDAAGETNVAREVVFEGLKIDRAMPPKEAREEFLKRFSAEQESIRKQYEEGRLRRQRR